MGLTFRESRVPLVGRLWIALRETPWWLPFLFLALLSLDACSRPSGYDPRYKTIVGEWMHPKPRAVASHPPNLHYLILLKADLSVGVVPEWASASDRRAAELGGAQRVCLFGPSNRNTGFWGITSRETKVIVLDDPGWSADERRRVGQAIVDLLAVELPEADKLRRAAQMLRDGTLVNTESVYSGYVHNAFAISLATALIWSLTLGRPWRSWRSMRAPDVLARGRCPRCRYAIGGYPGTTCPECGFDWSAVGWVRDPPREAAEKSE